MRAPAPLTPAPYHKPTGGDGEKGRWVPWVVWPLTVLIGLAYFASKAGMELSDLPTLSSLPSAEDGTYLYEAPVEEGGMWMRIAIRRGEAKLTASFGLSGTCRVERKGDTLRLVGGQLYQDGRPVPTLSQSRVDLMTVVDDGQALWIKDEGLNIRLIKQ